ncbi:hypothetical protein V6N12_073590 [Hibiscus sabdariffa]|uniref:Uncharacterized protein n=2 Tax=Hibiscus sabdariffa TaxID=183260 RepID=A0ABR2BI67_9ROSI
MEVDADRAQVVITKKKLGDKMVMILCSKFNEANRNNEAVDMEGDEASEYLFRFPKLQDNRSRRKYISIAEMQDKTLSLKEKKKREKRSCVQERKENWEKFIVV